MGDHRVSLSIKADFHGKTYEIKDAWWNYSGWNGVDERVVHFFEQMWDDGMRRYQEEIDEASREEVLAKRERTERAELARLQEKYGQRHGT